MKSLSIRLLLISWLLTSLNVLFAQTPTADVLHRLDRTTQNVRVKEITDVEVFYTDLNAPATVRKVRKAELWKIVFGDGTSDVYNEPKAVKTATETPAPKPTVTSAPTRSVGSVSVTQPRTAPTQSVAAGTGQATDLGTFLAGRKALSYGLNLSGSSTTSKTSKTSATATTNNMSLSVLYQKFKRDNVSVGGGVTLGFNRNKTSGDAVASTSLVGLTGLTRRYLPVASNVAFYGFVSAELALQWYNNKTATGIEAPTVARQQLALGAGAGLAYLFNERWSVDFNAALLGLNIDRYKAQLPGAEAGVDLSLTGAGVIPSFSLFFTRYF